MLTFLKTLLESDSLAPHGICLLWRPELVWTHAVSDALIGLAYFSIPLALAVFLQKRRDVAFSWMVWCFAIFILACGTTHFISIWTLWNPDYGMEAIIKVFTATASMATAAALWPLLPRAIALPSPAQLEAANAALRQRVAERDEALAALERETTERLRTEEMFRQAQKMESIGQLTGGVAHDFNNLLAVITANLERLERRLPGDDAETHRALQNALAGAERAAGLTRQLLAFARKQSLQPAPLDVDGQVERIVDLVSASLGHGIALRTERADDLPPVLADPNQLESALLNLVVNARDAMPEGGTLTIRTRLLKADDAGRVQGLTPRDHVVVAVSDTGEGMGPDVAEHAFEPFFTTKPLGQGSGLGLSQVYGFMKQSGGHAAIESEAGQGATVSLYFPRHDGAGGAAAASALRPAATAPL